MIAPGDASDLECQTGMCRHERAYREAGPRQLLLPRMPGDNNWALLCPDLFQPGSVADEPSGVNLYRTCFTPELTG